MKTLKLVFILILLMTISNCAGNNDKSQPEVESNEVSVAQLKEIVDSNRDIFLLDVRTQSEYDEGHVAFTDMLIPYDSLQLYLGNLPADKTTEIYCFCRSGRRSGIAMEFLNSQGYKAYNVTGGIIAWTEAGFEVIGK